MEELTKLPRFFLRGEDSFLDLGSSGREPSKLSSCPACPGLALSATQDKTRPGPEVQGGGGEGRELSNLTGVPD